MSGYGLRPRIGLFAGPALFFLIIFMPTPEGMSVEAQRVGAVAALMAVWWVSEALPIPAIALIPIGLFPLLGIMSSQEVTDQYANHIIYLFMGGFLIAVTMERWNLHKRIALNIINFVGVGPAKIILGFMIAAAFLSMWISNTATAMMMVPIGLAVIKQAQEIIREQKISGVDPSPYKFNFAIALMLGIAYACSIGGIGTIIGTPPNTVFVGVAENLFGHQISFVVWMMYGIPLSIIMLGITWIYLVRFAFPLEITELPGGKAFIQAELQKLGTITKEETRVLLIFGAVAAAWISRGFFDMGQVHDSTIAILGALVLFAFPSDYKKWVFLLDWETAVKIPWGIIILFGGGLAIAHGFSETGLAAWIAGQLTVLENYNIIILLLAVTGLTILLTELTSNTATATMLMPILSSMAIAMAIHPYGLMVAATIAASFAFMLPVATPPNAVVFASSFITIPHMAKAGLWLNIIGVIIITLFSYIILPIIWGIELTALPEWIQGNLLNGNK
jgi:solute carrier family 13 (sodium-dependent dicarboxylate transporter), member 2/3/5